MVDTQELAGTEMVVILANLGIRVPVRLVKKFRRTGDEDYFVVRLILGGPLGKFSVGSKVELSRVLIKDNAIRPITGYKILPVS